MANKYKGEVPFTDSTGQEYVLRLGTFQWLSHQDELQALLAQGKGRDYQCQLFHLALVSGSEAQKDLTYEDAVEIVDDLGYDRANELIEQTKFYKNVTATREAERVKKRAAAAEAAATLSVTLDGLKKDQTDPSVLKALDEVENAIQAMQPKVEGSANP